MSDEPEGRRLRTISYGGGVQSTALGVLATQGRIGRVDAMLFANVGDDSEHPATNAYVRDVFTPWAAERGIVVHELHRLKRDGSVETLMGRLMKEGSRSLPIPVRMSNGAPGNRSCTADFKIRVVGKWLKANGASAENPADVMIGISTDEVQRISNKTVEPHERPVYPLITLGLDRAACMQVIRDAGLPVPPKSACYFCPFHRPQTWAEQRRDEPDLFWKSVKLERHLNDVRDRISCHTEGVEAVDVEDRWQWFEGKEPRRVVDDRYDADGRHYTELATYADWAVGDLEAGFWVPFGRCPDCDRRDRLRLDPGDLVPPHRKDHVYLTRFGKPLDQAISEAQTTLPGFEPEGHETCDEGYCWT